MGAAYTPRVPESPRRAAPRLRLCAALAAVLTSALLLASCSHDEPAGEPNGSESSSAAGDAAATLIQTGLAQLSAGQDKSARLTFENALAVDPENLYALYNLGVIAQNAGRDDPALEFYDRALVSKADYAPALYNKAIIVEATDLEESVQLYRQVIGIDDQLAAAHMRLGFALVHLGQTDEGEGFLEQGIALDPAMADIEAPSYG